MDSTAVVLRPFASADIPALLSWVPAHADMVLWSGARFTWPLDAAQVEAFAAEAAGRYRIWTAYDARTGARVGHCSVRLDPGGANGRLGGVLVAPPARGTGTGRRMVGAAVDRAFGEPGLTRLELGVYEHNAPAMALYRRLGFRPSGAPGRRQQVDGATWTSYEMELTRDVWAAANNRRPDAS